MIIIKRKVINSRRKETKDRKRSKRNKWKRKIRVCKIRAKEKRKRSRLLNLWKRKLKNRRSQVFKVAVAKTRINDDYYFILTVDNYKNSTMVNYNLTFIKKLITVFE